MAHAPGWTLATLRIIWTSTLTFDDLEVVLHYDVGTLVASDANAAAAAAAIDAAISANTVALTSIEYNYTGVAVTLDDGVHQGDAVHTNIIPGGVSGASFPQVICVIVRKRCQSTGRKRFGHICWPAIPLSAEDTANTITNTYRGNLTLHCVFLQSGLVFSGTGASKMIIYHRATDTRNEVDFIEANAVLRTQRHRTPGRGA